MNSGKHIGAYEALLVHLNRSSIPEANALLSKVQSGGCLNEFELQHLSDFIEETQQLIHLEVSGQQNCKLSAELSGLLADISKQALENQQQAAKK